MKKRKDQRKTASWSRFTIPACQIIPEERHGDEDLTNNIKKSKPSGSEYLQSTYSISVTPVAVKPRWKSWPDASSVFGIYKSNRLKVLLNGFDLQHRNCQFKLFNDNQRNFDCLSKLLVDGYEFKQGTSWSESYVQTASQEKHEQCPWARSWSTRFPSPGADLFSNPKKKKSLSWRRVLLIHHNQVIGAKLAFFHMWYAVDHLWYSSEALMLWNFARLIGQKEGRYWVRSYFAPPKPACKSDWSPCFAKKAMASWIKSCKFGRFGTGSKVQICNTQ